MDADYLCVFKTTSLWYLKYDQMKGHPFDSVLVIIMNKLLL